MSIVEFDNLTTQLQELKNDMPDLEKALNLSKAKEQAELLEQQTMAPGFWNDSQNSEKIISKLNMYKSKINKYENLTSQIEDLETLIELGIEEQDESLVGEAVSMFNNIKTMKESQWISTLLSGEYDSENAVLTIHAGAGGTESCDWANMLLRMYTRYAERHGYKCEVLDFVEGDETGYKSVTIEISGENAYGYLKSEQGIHRLVRISPFNAAGKRQTSFVSVDVMPDIDKDIDIDIADDDLRIDTYRSSGAGGQHINKTSSAVRITHIPTGIVVQCQNERSQHMNKDKAMKLLKSKLLLLKEAEQAENLSDIRGEVREINFGSQIRSYVLQPYTMVKDHRTNIDCGNASKVLDGDLDIFITGYLVNLAK